MLSGRESGVNEKKVPYYYYYYYNKYYKPLNEYLLTLNYIYISPQILPSNSMRLFKGQNYQIQSVRANL